MLPTLQKNEGLSWTLSQTEKSQIFTICPFIAKAFWPSREDARGSGKGNFPSKKGGYKGQGFFFSCACLIVFKGQKSSLLVEKQVKVRGRN